MKISDFDITAKADQERSVEDLIAGFNRSETDYERDTTIHQLFCQQAEQTPDATALIVGDETLSYRQLDQRSNQLARLLIGAGLVQEQRVCLLLDRSIDVVVSMLGTLKAGGAYVAVNIDQPYPRVQQLIANAEAAVIIASKQNIRTLNKLHWDTDASHVLCIDSDDFVAEVEEEDGLMAQEIWDYVAEETFDDISGGGWKSSYTGEWLSREVMDEYGENIRKKLSPHLTPTSRVLEIGCASGISMFRLAPVVGHYHGTDISPKILEWCQTKVDANGLTNISLSSAAAHEIDELDDDGFDVIVINSVLECFPGHNYFRRVLNACISKLRDKGLIFLGNVWDQDRKSDFIESLRNFKAQNSIAATRAKLEREDELYISKGFLQDLQHDLPVISQIDYSELDAQTESELSRFSFDALLHIDKAGDSAIERDSRTKTFLDRRALFECEDTPLTFNGSAESAQSLAYLAFTSGTSGSPKGALIEHRSVIRLVRGTTYIDLNEQTRILQTGSLAFDASTFEIWGALLNGGVVCLPQGSDFLSASELSRLIRSNGITTLFLTTGLLNHLVDADIGAFEGLKTLLSGGEKVSPQHFNSLRSTYPELELKHVYGPTENTTFSSCFNVDRSYTRDIPIGRPISNSTAYIYDEHGRLLGPGRSGELYLGGDGLARGYLNAEALTQEKFVPDPLRPDQRLYRTGDLARWTTSGELEFLGRIDAQVKVRGYRIEPSEIEYQLCLHANVREAVVTPRIVAGVAATLIAYVGAVDVKSVDLLDHLRATLPEYMIPAEIVVLDTLPLGPTGKVDTAALPVPQDMVTTDQQRLGPENETERALLSIWNDILQRTDFGVTDDFFDLGGHSLKIVKLTAEIQKKLGVEVPMMAVFAKPTIRALSLFIADTRALNEQGLRVSQLEEPMIKLSSTDVKGRVVLAFPPGSGYCLSYCGLAERLAGTSVYGFNFVDTDDLPNYYADRIVAAGFTCAPVLLGYSGGGKIAYQVARALEQRNMKVGGLIFLDSARYLQPIAVSEDNWQEAARDFFDSIHSEVLRGKALNLMKLYRKYIHQCVESDVISANIHLIREANGPDEFRNDNGEIIAGSTIWQDLTRGKFSLEDGYGTHVEMLEGPHLDHNVGLIQNALDSLPLD
ncbi:MAG: AMP-binding protein [Arenicella sp.]